jgi:glycosyltransferase involved in cell wall biosynthesis
MADPILSVILPCYNESKGLENILKRFQECGLGVDFELILVDNGSTDRSTDVLAALLPSYPFARSVRVEKNVGYGHGILTGLQSARGEVLAWSHADLQTDPADVFRALRLYQSEGDASPRLVKGRRNGRSLQERIISRGMEIVSLLLLRTRLTEINAQPKLFPRRLLQNLTHPPTDFNFDVYVLYQARQERWRIEAFEVIFPPRKYGQSNWAATWRSKIRTIARSMWFMFKLGLGWAR